MKVEELYRQEKQSQVGVTLQRRPFETEVDIIPHLSPFVESMSSADEAVMTELTGAQTEEMLSRVAKHQPDEDFQGIPLKRIDSGPHEHRLQSCRPSTSVEVEVPSSPRHEALLAQIDAAEEPPPSKRENTLTRMLKGMRGDKDDKSLTRMLHRMNPLGKTSRESLSKVFHRIGDAVQKRGEDRGCSPGRGKKEARVDVSKSSGPAKVGDKMFKCRPSNKDSDNAA